MASTITIAARTGPGIGVPPSEALSIDVPLMTSAEVGELLRVSQATLCRWRRTGTGPRAIWLSPRVPRYLRADVQRWMERNRS